MNYIELVNNFWQKDLEHNFSDKEVAFYFYLLKVSNSIAWKNPFGLSNAITIAKFGWGKTAFDTAKNALKEAGLIDFKAGNGRKQTYQYELKYIKKDTCKHTLSDSLSDTFCNTFSESKPATSININTNKRLKEVKEVKEKAERFSPPSLQDIEAYCLQRKNNINPVGFFNFYQSKGWMVGRNTMKDWQASVRTWEQKEKQKGDNNGENRTGVNKSTESIDRKHELMQRAGTAIAGCSHQNT